MNSSDILIIGSGLAGYLTAMAFRKKNIADSVAIVSESQGHFYSKPTLSTAYAHQRSVSDLITKDRSKMIEQYALSVYSQQTVISVDAQAQCVKTAQGGVFEYRKGLVLACGAQARRLQCQGNGVDAVLSVNQWEDYVQLRSKLKDSQRVLIVGSGLVGSELCCDLKSGGHDVVCVHDAPWPIHQLLPQPLGDAIKMAFQSAGIDWKGPDYVVSVDHDDQGWTVKLQSGQVIEADCVISAIGMSVDTRWAESAGLSVSDGIETDAYLRTSVSNIYALGDCAKVAGVQLFYIAPLRRCAQALAQTLSGVPTAVDYPAMPVVVKTPLCPLVVCPPPRGAEGQWVIEGKAPDLLARFESHSGTLLGFAVTGECVRERAPLQKLLNGSE